MTSLQGLLLGEVGTHEPFTHLTECFRLSLVQTLAGHHSFCEITSSTLCHALRQYFTTLLSIFDSYILYPLLP